MKLSDRGCCSVRIILDPAIHDDTGRRQFSGFIVPQLEIMGAEPYLLHSTYLIGAVSR